MPIDNDHFDLPVADAYFRVRPPQPLEGLRPTHPRFILLLHGWTGDENSMWVFENALPRNAWLAAPRAPFPSARGEGTAQGKGAAVGGYTWLAGDPTNWPPLSGWVQTCDDLIDRLDILGAELNTSVKTFDVLGFSQGGAMAYALSILYPNRTRQAGILAGFLPEPELAMNSKIPALRPGGLTGKRYYVAHGMRDDRVPVVKARHAVEVLEHLGALVTYCEADTGHKLSAGCLHALRGFFHSPEE